MSLIEVTHPDRALPTELLDARGGFSWWYLDLLDDTASGVVAIWSFGLPFLPGYLGATRRGLPEKPSQRPSLNIVVYEHGEATFYLLQEYPSGQASRHGDVVRLGASTFESRIVDGRRIVRAEIDCPVPMSTERLAGTLTLDGVARRDDHAPRDVPLSAHDWSPLTGPSMARAALDLDGRPFVRLEGRGYHDRNGSSEPFDRLGIEHWLWGRFPFEERERIVYLLFPENRRERPELVALDIEADGTTRRATNVDVSLESRRRARFGMPYWDRVIVSSDGAQWLTLSMDELLDDGPFYLRFGANASDARGERVKGTVELVRPRRVDLALQRPFVRMKVHRVAGDNSSWLGLFTGPRRGRVTRQLRSLVPTMAARLPMSADEVAR